MNPSLYILFVATMPWKTAATMGLFRVHVVYRRRAQRKLQEQRTLAFVETILFSLIKQVRFGTPQVDNFRAAISILFQNSTLSTVISIGDTDTTANHTTSLSQLLGERKAIARKNYLT